MSLGAFAGGLTKGYAAGEEIKDLREKRKQSERRTALLEAADIRAAEAHEQGKKKFGWEEEDRARKDEDRKHIEGVFGELNQRFPEGFNPVGNPEHGRALEEANGKILAYRFSRGMGTKDDVAQFREGQRLMKDEANRRAVIGWLTTGDFNALAPLAQSMGFDPAQLKPAKTPDGQVGVQLPSGEVMPNAYFHALLTGGDVQALRQRDQRHGLEVKKIEAATAESRARQAAAQESRGLIQAQRSALNTERGEQNERAAINDILSGLTRKGTKDPLTGVEGPPDHAHNTFARRLVADSIAAHGGRVNARDMARIQAEAASTIERIEDEAASLASRAQAAGKVPKGTTPQQALQQVRNRLFREHFEAGPPETAAGSQPAAGQPSPASGAAPRQASASAQASSLEGRTEAMPTSGAGQMGASIGEGVGRTARAIGDAALRPVSNVKESVERGRYEKMKQSIDKGHQLRGAALEEFKRLQAKFER